MTLTADALRKLCHPVRITPPGQEVQQVAEMLGCHPQILRDAMRRGTFRVHYVPGLGGKHGKPVPLIYADRLFDPSSGRLTSRPDPIWGSIWQSIANLLPDDFQQTLTRIPTRRARGPLPIDPDRPAHARPHRFPHMPPPPPDWVWYKWKNGVFHDPYARPRRKRKPRNRKPKICSPHHMIFSGWRWLCPACKKPVRTLYYPFPAFNLLDYLGEEIPAHEADEIQTPPPTFACRKCHKVCFFSSLTSHAWNHLVSHLSGGLLFGHEVKKPESFVPVRHNKYGPRINSRPSRRRQQVLDLILAGRMCRQIADELGIGLGTVYNHLRELRRQYNVHRRADLHRCLGQRPPLGPKSQQVFHRLFSGHSYKRIAAGMHRTVGTINSLVNRVYRYYGVHSRKQLIAAVAASRSPTAGGSQPLSPATIRTGSVSVDAFSAQGRKTLAHGASRG